jgi:hypothetical protein
VLILTISEYFHELLQNRVLTASTALRKFCRVVVMAIYIAFVLVVAVLCPENGRTQGARKMFNVVFSIERSDVRAAKSASALIA